MKVIHYFQIIAIACSIGYGVLCGYLHYHKIPMPEIPDAVWLFFAFLGLLAALAWCVAALTNVTLLIFNP